MPETDEAMVPKRSTDANVSVRPRSNISGTIDINTLLAFGFGIIVLGVMLAFSTYYPNPTPFQIQVFMTALSLSAAGVGAVLPGYLHIRYKNMVRVGGALGLCAAVWFSQPAIVSSVVTLEEPVEPVEPIINQFLEKLDRGDIEGTFAQIDEVARNEMDLTLDIWRQLYENNLAELGAVEWRKLAGRNALTSPPGAPIGLYRQLSYLTKYENVNGCRMEQVTARAAQDNKWRVYSYLISRISVDCGPPTGPVSN